MQPRVCEVGKPNQKGGVERAIRYMRDRFLAGRSIQSIDQGNRELEEFLAHIADKRPHPRDPTRTVGEVLQQERHRLLPLPDPLPATELIKPARVDKTAFVRYDSNDYSVPPQYARQTLTLVCDDRVVRLVDGSDVVAAHQRSPVL